MSVAFRRESDEEHKEPRFELPIPPGPNLVTPRGRALIDARIAELDAAQAEAEADEPRREEIARDLRYWQTRRVTAILAPAPPADEIAFGSRVEFTLNGEPRTIEIVGDDEADPAAGKIAFSAPLARALIGAGEGDVLPFAGRDDAIEVIAVEATFAD
ncbi:MULTISPECIES: GreA/GreB family elongation factor [Sphingomonas]|uniref:GreA/GreB family elongation factor n=1 Tax=Sphingomonas lycopersici TaxID=2951807 RepID=A0AA42CQA4_9SPHN|nr:MULTISPECIES: GreA/GreB family elongation factor [Sphingomonas]MCW6531538.1 GreA/GreB family elongation factor [Sphingomonas lycopersici]MCW6535099.1 GreA/GreB family elongation factor [Sphingomonas lycopersici]OJU19536.1 MAG: nucleoside-diphosphate kinase [Sphingomonas sp. 66-10]